MAAVMAAMPPAAQPACLHVQEENGTQPAHAKVIYPIDLRERIMTKGKLRCTLDYSIPNAEPVSSSENCLAAYTTNANFVHAEDKKSALRVV